MLSWDADLLTSGGGVTLSICHRSERIRLPDPLGTGFIFLLNAPPPYPTVWYMGQVYCFFNHQTLVAHKRHRVKLQTWQTRNKFNKCEFYANVAILCYCEVSTKRSRLCVHHKGMYCLTAICVLSCVWWHKSYQNDFTFLGWQECLIECQWYADLQTICHGLPNVKHLNKGISWCQVLSNLRAPSSIGLIYRYVDSF